MMGFSQVEDVIKISNYRLDKRISRWLIVYPDDQK